RALGGIGAAHADAFLAEGLPADAEARLASALQTIARARDARAEASQQFAAAAQSIRDTQNKADATLAALEAVADHTAAARPEVVTKLRVAMRVGGRRID